MEKVRGLNDVVSGSKVKVIKPDGIITEEEAVLFVCGWSLIYPIIYKAGVHYV